MPLDQQRSRIEMGEAFACQLLARAPLPDGRDERLALRRERLRALECRHRHEVEVVEMGDHVPGRPLHEAGLALPVL